ncbi:MAG: hypothetical protein IPG06_22935 [Haliea sp.]|nr:hypothetical protein [Haliea sp.]
MQRHAASTDGVIQAGFMLTDREALIADSIHRGYPTRKTGSTIVQRVYVVHLPYLNGVRLF